MRYLVLWLLFSSCAGYRPVSKTNPLADQGIDSVAVPVFVNRSSIAMAGAFLTKEFLRVLQSYPGLAVSSAVKSGRSKSGHSKSSDSDAVLIGIVDSPAKREQAVAARARVFSDQLDSAVTEKRLPFYLTNESTLNLSVRLILIRDPAAEQLTAARHQQLARAMQDGAMQKGGQIVFNRVIGISKSFSRTLFSDEETKRVNFTQTRQTLKAALAEASRSAARDFQGMIIENF